MSVSLYTCLCTFYSKFTEDGNLAQHQCLVINSLINLSSLFLKVYYVPDTVSGAGNIRENKIDKVPTLMELTFPAKEAENKWINKIHMYHSQVVTRVIEKRSRLKLETDQCRIYQRFLQQTFRKMWLSETGMKWSDEAWKYLGEKWVGLTRCTCPVLEQVRV